MKRAFLRAIILGVSLVYACTQSTQAATCDGGNAVAAQKNAQSLTTLSYALFGGSAETGGWRRYEARVQNEISTECPGSSPQFGERLAAWQGVHHLRATGIVDAQTLRAMSRQWQSNRSFWNIRSQGICPAAPVTGEVGAVPDQYAVPKEHFRLRPRTLQQLEAMSAAATASGILPPGQSIRIFSGFRSPESDAQRCAREKNCDDRGRASCSNHRTGYAIDIYLGEAKGHWRSDTGNTNRDFVARQPLYFWLVRNAGQYGFVNYAYEPWHWELNGQ